MPPGKSGAMLTNMKRFYPFIFIVVAALMAASCDESTTQAGSSLVEDEVEIVYDSSFSTTGISDPNTSVHSRTILQLLGRLNAKGYGEFSSDIVCQYMSAANVDTTNTTAKNPTPIIEYPTPTISTKTGAVTMPATALSTTTI